MQLILRATCKFQIITSINSLTLHCLSLRHPNHTRALTMASLQAEINCIIPQWICVASTFFVYWSHPIGCNTTDTSVPISSKTSHFLWSFTAMLIYMACGYIHYTEAFAFDKSVLDYNILGMAIIETFLFAMMSRLAVFLALRRSSSIVKLLSILCRSRSE